jgi:hypothetical protein
MFQNRMAALALTIGSLVTVAAPSAWARNRHDDERREFRQERRLTDRERRLAEQQQRIARERYLREQAQRQRYASPYRDSARDGYYDRYGQWHWYSYPGSRY